MQRVKRPPTSARHCWRGQIPNCATKSSCCSRSAVAAEFLDRPAIEHASDLLEDSAAVSLAAGARLGPYCIEYKLGEGGMGEVFRAVDTRLGRAVAIKITQEQFSARFEREARAIASLNHPNICTIHDVGPNYLVMELVEGETLAARLKRGPLPMNTALLYASQIAAALAEAHAKGIVHRDLKPGNIMIARSGIKVLDFGLAKSGQDQTVTASRMVMGTPAYMAPEQREGKPADARSDIYSFGCVLYEMLTGATSGTPAEAHSVTKAGTESSAGASKKTQVEGGTPLRSCSRNWRSITPAQTRDARRRRRRGDSGVVCRGRILRSSPCPETHRQGHDRARRFHQYDRRSGVRRDAATGTRGPTPAVAVPQPHLGGAYPEGADADATAARRATDVQAGSGCVRAHG